MAKDAAEALIVKFIPDLVEAAGAKGAVIGLCGVFDSATIAFLSVRVPSSCQGPRPLLLETEGKNGGIKRV